MATLLEAIQLFSLHSQVFWFYSVLLSLHIHALTQKRYLLNTYYMAVSVLDTGDPKVHKTDKHLWFLRSNILRCFSCPAYFSS